MIFSDGVHICSDISTEDLHVQMKRLGIKRCWFHSGSKFPHYDAPKRIRGDKLFQLYPEIYQVHPREIYEIIKNINTRTV